MQSNRHALRTDGTKRRVLLRASIAAVATVLSLPLALFAHAHLSRSEPSARERLTSPPKAIRLWFSERPELGFTRVRLRAADSSEVALGNGTRIADDPMGVSFAISQPLPAGRYTVLWRTAAADGHPSSGSFGFDVVSAAAAARPDTAAPPANGHALVHVDSTSESLPSLNVSAATRWLEFIAMLAVVGGVVFQLLVLPRADRAMAGALAPEARLEIADTARRFVQSALVLLVVASASRLYDATRAVLGPDHPVDRATLAMMLGTSWGTGWLVGLIGVVVTAIGVTLVRRVRPEVGWFVAALGAAAIGMSPALTGHAAATPPVPIAVASDVLHVLMASAWIGTLLAVLFVSLPFVRGRHSIERLGSGPLIASLVRAFHPVALTCAGLVIVSGVVSSWLRLPTLASLWTSTYGRVLLLKLAFVAAVIVLGAVNWRRMLPALGDERAARRITRTASAELTIAALVLAVTAVLVSVSPPDRAIVPSTSSAER